MKSITRVLLEEDDRSIADFVEPELERLDFSVRCTQDGVSSLEEAKRFGPELVLLDMMLPKLTACDVTMDKVHSLDLGADDYVTKPFEMPELPARSEAAAEKPNLIRTVRLAGYNSKGA